MASEDTQALRREEAAATIESSWCCAGQEQGSRLAGQAADLSLSAATSITISWHQRSSHVLGMPCMLARAKRRTHSPASAGPRLFEAQQRHEVTRVHVPGLQKQNQTLP